MCLTCPFSMDMFWKRVVLLRSSKFHFLEWGMVGRMVCVGGYISRLEDGDCMAAPFHVPCLLLRCNVMLNLFQQLTASLSLPFSAHRSWNKFRMTSGGSCYLYSHFWEANSILMFDSFSRLARFVVRSPSWRRPIASSSHRGEDVRMGRRGLSIPLQRYNFILYLQNKNELFLWFCKILLESLFLKAGGCDFFMARKILRPRHAVCFMWRGRGSVRLWV